MTTAISVARYILDERERRGHSTTTFALQKFLYLCKGWSLVAKNDALFTDAMSAWDHGPVIDSTWPYCRGRYYISSSALPDLSNDKELSESQTSVINRVLDMFDSVDDSSLGDKLEGLSHRQDPWRNARVTKDCIITDVSLKKYFESLQADPPEEQKQYVPLLADLSDRTIISDEDMSWLETTFGLSQR